ncbi:DMT family transporter [Arthrobacter sp. I2-34]|uniref:DMT family transporter n=1 Tax=Arthrobacter hankyongi TaxID=2904801 RepID=A0ABS9L5E2_9MICC|nr:DMT family transporter [Arthrobacter hankyongi]MCG2621901.1 DMT family transporter [Arthrobacter hankyongi]
MRSSTDAAALRPPRSLAQPGVSGVWIALASSAVFGLSGSFAKSLLEAGWTPGAAVAVRMLGAALLLLVPALVLLRGRWSTLRSNWRTIVLFGLFGVAGCQLFYFNAVSTLSVGVALLLEYLAPVLIVLWLWISTRRTPRTATIAGSLLSLAGLVLVLDVAGGMKLDVGGVLWGLGAAVCLVVYFFITAKQNDGLPPLVLAAGGMLVGGATMLLLGAVRVLPMQFSLADSQLAAWPTPWWVPLAGLIVFSTVLAYVSGIMAARALGSTVASFVSLTEVLFAVLWAWLLLGELPAGIQLTGGALIVAGVLLVRLDELRPPRARASRTPSPAAPSSAVPSPAAPSIVPVPAVSVPEPAAPAAPSAAHGPRVAAKAGPAG